MSIIGSISNNAFKDQISIKSAVFGSNCWSVGENAFESCTSLEEINENNVIKKIGKKSFSETNLHSVSFNNLDDVSQGAFLNCYNLKNIHIPNCEQIQSSAFENCTSLTYVYSPKCVNIEKSAFKNCPSLRDIPFVNILNIGDESFESCSSLQKVVLSKCKKIGTSSFKNCSKLSQVSLYKCESIGSNAFSNCSSLTKVYINNNSVFCKLEDKNAFCICDEETECSNNNIIFFINKNKINLYKNDENWRHYIKNMVALPLNNEIIYSTINNEIIETNDDVIENKYDTDGGFGLLKFKNQVTSLNINDIFNSNVEKLTKLTHIILPQTCITIEKNSLKNCKNLKDIVLFDILYINEYAFENCESLSSFTIPESVEKIEEGAFVGCKNIEKIEGKYTAYDGKSVVFNRKLICVLTNTYGRVKVSDIDSNIIYLGKSCFKGCTNIRRIDIHSDIEYIGDNAFEGCENLCEIHFEGSNPPKLGENLFEDVRGDFKLFVPEEYFETYNNEWSEYVDNIFPKPKNNSIIYYSDVDVKKKNQIHREFEVFTNGDYYIISNINNSIPNEYFKNSSIKKIILPDNITEIGISAFEGCEELTYIYIPTEVKKINNTCFYNCNSLLNIYIPSNQDISFGNDIFYKCSNLEKFITFDKEYLSDDNRCYIKDGELKFFAQGGDVGDEYTIPDNITSINRSAFRGSTIKNITVSKSTTTIGEYAFEGCTNLESINDWDSVVTVSNSAFKGCENIDKIKIPNSLKTIGDSAFEGCTKLKCVDGSGENTPLDLNGITEINQHIFFGCSSLTEIDINKDVTTIGKGAFEGCTKLTSVSIPKSSQLKSIYANAFKGCVKLETLNLPNTLTNIGRSAFEDCEAYKGYKRKLSTNENGLDIYDSSKTLTMPEDITSIGISCFKNSGIETLDITKSKNLTEIPDSAFEGCKNLSSIDISNSNISNIGAKSFYQCKKLYSENLDLSNNIKSIGDEAFYECENIYSISLSSNINRLGNQSFDTKSSNISINITSTLNPPIFTLNGNKNTSSIPFGEPNEKSDSLKIFVPKLFENMYINNEYWEKYKMYINANRKTVEDYISTIICSNILADGKSILSINFVEIPSDWNGATIKFNIYNKDGNSIESGKNYSIKFNNNKSYTVIFNSTDTISNIIITSTSKSSMLYSGKKVPVGFLGLISYNII